MKFTQNKKWPAILLVITVLILGMKWREVLNVLTQEDLQAEQDQAVPALSSPLDEGIQWESYNEWKCFNRNEVDTLCVDVCLKSEDCALNDWVKKPLISVLHQEQLLEFDVDPPLKKSCDEILLDWNEIMEGQDVVCIFAAHLQDEVVSQEEAYSHHSIWVLDHFKTAVGQWP